MSECYILEEVDNDNAAIGVLRFSTETGYEDFKARLTRVLEEHFDADVFFTIPAWKGEGGFTGILHVTFPDDDAGAECFLRQSTLY